MLVLLLLLLLLLLLIMLPLEESRGPGIDPFRAGGLKWIYTRSTGFQSCRLKYCCLHGPCPLETAARHCRDQLPQDPCFEFK